MKFKIFNTKIYISFIFVSLLTLMLATDRTGYIIPSVSAVILHELGHLFTMWLFECCPKEIKLLPSSIEIVRGFSDKPYGETVIALMGPVTNLFLALVFYINYISIKNELLLIFMLVNLIIGFFNLLPLNGLDGGTILFNIISKKFSTNIATKALSIITLICGFVLLSLGFFMILNKNYNISIIIIALYLIIPNGIKLINNC